MKFTLPDQLPPTAAELAELAGHAVDEINVFLARKKAGDEFTDAEADRLEYLVTSKKTIDAEHAKVAASEQTHADRLSNLLESAAAAAAPVAPAAPAPPAATPEATPEGDAGAEVVAEAEAATAEAAAPVTAGTGARPFANAVKDSAPPGPVPGEKRKGWRLLPSAPNYVDFAEQDVDTAVIAAGISSKSGKYTGIRKTGQTVLAKMDRPQGRVFEKYEEFYAELDRLAAEIPGHGKVNAQALVAAGGWCAPSEQMYDFCPTPAAGNLISLPEITVKRGGVIFPAEPDFSALQTGFHFTETELEATAGDPPVPTAVKEFVEIPCPDDMVEYRLEAIGWAIKSGILQKQAWPELIKKFLDEFMVEHQYRISAKTIVKMLAASSAAKVVPTAAIFGATTGILNGLHVRSRNLQIKTRKDTIEGVAPVWFRDVLRADLAARDGKDMLDVSDGQIDAWLAVRGIYLQYEGRWQSLTSGQPGHVDTSWWPGSVDVMLYPAATFFRSLDNVITLGVQYPIEMVQYNRQMEGFVEDSFLVGKRCDPSHLIRIPLCVNGAIGAREEIVCSYATTTATITITGAPDGGTFTLKFSANDIASGNINYNASAANVKTALVAIDDSYVAANFTTTGGALPTTAVVVTYPAALGTLQVGTDALTGGTDPEVTVA